MKEEWRPTTQIRNSRLVFLKKGVLRELWATRQGALESTFPPERNGSGEVVYLELETNFEPGCNYRLGLQGQRSNKHPKQIKSRD